MAVNLNPETAISAFEQRLSKGKFIRMPAEAGDHLTGQVIEFQYNPDTITRARTGQWESRNRRRQTSNAEVNNRSAQGSAALLADSETISMKVVFDATEALLAHTSGSTDADDATKQGITQQLAVFELIPMGKAADPRQQSRSSGRRDSIRPVKPDQLLLVLGNRYFPVVITSMTITEQKFNPQLVPIRAEVDLKMNVLEPNESAYNNWIKRAFDHVVETRKEKARAAYGLAGEASLSAIEQAITNGENSRRENS